MPGLAVGWEYLTGYAVATSPTGRDRAEWPPHPGRVFMAMAAAYFETGEDPAEGEALRWLETMGDPDLHLPPREQVFERSAVTVYVPVNDKPGPAKMTLQCLPSITRSKQPRTFPRVWVGHDPCFMYWSRVAAMDEHRSALDRLCSKVTRVGHSSSLVRMWVSDEASLEYSANERLVADDQLAETQARSIAVGTLGMLAERFNGPARNRYLQLSERLDGLKTERKTVKGGGSRERKAAIDTEMSAVRNELATINPRPPLRPSLGLWSGYRRSSPVVSREHLKLGQLDPELLVLTQIDGPQLSLDSTLTATQALRGAIIKHVHRVFCGCDRWTDKIPSPSEAAECYSKIPAWVSGHQADGQPLRDGGGHIAYIPLPFVGREHADGHLLGAGLVFPRTVDRRERGRVLGNLLLDETGQPRPVELTLGRLGVWAIAKRDWSDSRLTVRPETWTAHPDGTDAWASVTPVVLDRFPKTDRVKSRGGWTDEVAEIIVDSCTRMGLPRPRKIDLDTTSWHRGSLRAVTKHRVLRGHGDATIGGGTPMGDGFLPFPAKGTKGHRPQVHVWLRFSEPVVGPVLLGAGRYLGYGLFKPWKADSQ